MKYHGNSKPYIYVSYAKENKNEAAAIMEKLSFEGVLFWYSDTINKRELKRIEFAHAVLFFISEKNIRSQNLRKAVDHAVRMGKNILTVYLQDVEMDAWGHMQLSG